MEKKAKKKKHKNKKKQKKTEQQIFLILCRSLPINFQYKENDEKIYIKM